MSLSAVAVWDRIGLFFQPKKAKDAIWLPEEWFILWGINGRGDAIARSKATE